MRLVEWARGRPLAVAAAAGVVAGTVVGLLWPIKVPPASQRPEPPWSMPARLSTLTPSDREFAAVRDAPAWGDAPQTPGVKRSGWRLLGIIAHPVPAALVDDGQKRTIQVRVGEALPDGGKLLEVTPKGVAFALGGCRRERLLYVAAPADGGTCIPAPASK